MTIASQLGLISNPFENYTAENEPDIGAYAVRPPYLKAISERAKKLSSFILFGDRGSGKSATRLTVFKEIWALSKEDKPFIVNLTDFSEIQTAFKKDKLTEKNIIHLVAFCTIEQMLAWLASLPNDERDQKLDSLNKTELTLIFALVKGFYLSKPEIDREISNTETLQLLNSAWTTKSAIWTSQRWDAISKILASALNVLTQKSVEDNSVDISGPAEALLKSLVGDSPAAPRATLMKLVDFSRIFGFSGVCILVDKLDETPATSNSAESTAKLIYPLLAHIQLLEIQGFSWILFIWSIVQQHFNEKHSIRLDKIAHANISWEPDNLKDMLNKRIRFFSSGRIDFIDLFDDSIRSDETINLIISISVGSPRELIKLMDIIVREHDARDSQGLINNDSLEIGLNKYCTETIESWYSKSLLQQVYRVGKNSFVNKDVQSTFKISDQGARVKIKTWEDSGLVKQSGTVPSDAGGKPVYRYIVSDPRVIRIINNKLDAAVGAAIEDHVSEIE
ncbi:hypothetical protein SAMN04244574_04282 [Azotobacter beijerinckii]|uniref:Uncharacterized protein n=2 Tax=Azotobacter beijerinckii TaxID=170623 RepID=A0A1I4HLA3_9GAMM|nr:hypothetical protein SAMN04244574_04282 [Azotobacter beijerinckii]